MATKKITAKAKATVVEKTVEAAPVAVEHEITIITYKGFDNIVHAKAAIVGRDGIKANTFYTLSKDGYFVEVICTNQQ